MIDSDTNQDIGYGHIENCKGKAAAFEKAKKEAATDALKRALRNFGNVLGNCLYDKDYLQRVTKVKVQPSRWDAENLHRHPDFAPATGESKAVIPAKQIADKPTEQPAERPASIPIGRTATSNFSVEFEDDFGGNLFDGVELAANNTEDVNMDGPSRPDTPVIPQQPQNLQEAVPAGKPMPQQHQPQQPPAQFIAPQRPAPPQQAQNTAPQNNAQQNNARIEQSRNIQSRPPQAQAQKAHPMKPQHSTPPEQQAPPHPQPIQQPTPQSLQHPVQMNNLPQSDNQAAPAGHEPPIGFYTSRALPPNGGGVTANLRFNPNAESPSIRKTSGFNHGLSRPITRAAQSVGAAAADSAVVNNRAGSVGPGATGPVNNGAPTNFVNPTENMARRIGVPGGGMSPAPMRTSAYKPPTMTGGGAKRSYAASVGAAQVDGAMGAPPPREPLKDVSNVPGGAVGVDGSDAKRLKADA